MDNTTLLTIVSIILGGGFVTALIAVYKARPERDSVIVSSTQNAAEILQGLNTALYAELERERGAREKAEQRAAAMEARADAAEARANAAESRADRAEQRANASEQRADTAERRADDIVTKASALEERVRGLEKGA